MAAAKYTTYGLLLLLLYVLQTTPAFLEFWGVKPFLVIPAAVCIAMYEGELIGGLFGAFGGLLCDLGSYTVFGFYSILLLVSCAIVGLAILYLMKQNRLSALLLCGGILLVLGLLEHFFYFGMWGYQGAWSLLVSKMLPRTLLTLLLVPAFYRFFGWLFAYFASKVED